MEDNKKSEKKLDDFINILDKKRISNEKKFNDHQSKTLSNFCDTTRKLKSIMKDKVDLNKLRTYVHEILINWMEYFLEKKIDSKDMDFKGSIEYFEKNIDHSYKNIIVDHLHIFRKTVNGHSHTLPKNTELFIRESNLIFEQSLFLVDFIFELVYQDVKKLKEKPKKPKNEEKVKLKEDFKILNHNGTFQIKCSGILDQDIIDNMLEIENSDYDLNNGQTTFYYLKENEAKKGKELLKKLYPKEIKQKKEIIEEEINEEEIFIEIKPKKEHGIKTEHKKDKKVKKGPECACMYYASGVKCQNSKHDHDNYQINDLIHSYTNIGKIKCRYGDDCPGFKKKFISPLGSLNTCIFDHGEDHHIKQIIRFIWNEYKENKISLDKARDPKYIQSFLK